MLSERRRWVPRSAGAQKMRRPNSAADSFNPCDGQNGSENGGSKGAERKYQRD